MNRFLVVWCPDWPVVASGVASEAAVAVVAANQVVACSQAARAEGVRRGLRRREAQGRCPQLELVDADPSRDARAFEAVVRAVEAFAIGVEILRPGVVALATRGPSRYHGGDHALAVKLAEAVDTTVAAAFPGAPACRIGVADGRFAAEQAARLTRSSLDRQGTTAAARQPAAGEERVTVVPAGESGPFVAPLPVATIPYPDLAGLLHRLGIRTLGDLAALPAPSVLARFGPEGMAAHRLAGGVDERGPAARTPPPDLAVSAELDPPAERVDTAAFVAKALADDLHGRLAGRGLACSRVAIEAETEHGEHLVRLWRHEGALTAGAIAERVRWQLDGWLRGGGTTGGLTLLRLSPDEVHADNGRQQGFWGRGPDEGVARTLARLQGLLGPEGVVTAVIGGGRDPAGAVQLVSWGEPPAPGTDPAPWPGRLPGPAPAVVHVPPLGAELRDGAGRSVTVSGRGEVSAAPAALAVAGGPWLPVAGWAGPWPVEERWWDGGRRRARFQVVMETGAAHLLVREAGAWWVEATYD